MPFSGKATYSAGATLPEAAEDVSDLVSIVSPFETPLLDALGDSMNSARSTVHEWIEDTLLPNTDKVNDSTYTNALTDTTFVVVNASRFRVGDQIRVNESTEIMLVTGVDTGTNTLTVVRGYGGSTAASLANNQPISILGNAALEGDDSPAARFTARTRKINYTQIFTAGVEISGSELAVRQIGINDEMDYQKSQRVRELIRDLENVVINGRAPASNPEGNASTRRSMKGILQSISTNVFKPNIDGFPNYTQLNEESLNVALLRVWQSAASRPDLIVVSGHEKRMINNFASSSRRFDQQDERYKRVVSVYESDFGVCRIIVSRWVPKGTVLLLDSGRISVMPLAGRSFQFKSRSSNGDREAGLVVGEYTNEFRNESAHAVITGLTE